MEIKGTELKNILNFKQLEKLFRNYSLTSGLDVALYGPDGEEQLSVRTPGSICEYVKGHSACRDSVVYSGKKAVELGSAYIYETPCGLVMCITPLVVDGETFGYITTGPVVLWEKDEFFLDEFRIVLDLVFQTPLLLHFLRGYTGVVSNPQGKVVDGPAHPQLFPQLEDTCMSVQFSHIMSGGYAAGYYSYKWAEVLDADAFSLFREKGIFNTDVAQSFRDNILSRGGTEPPMVLYKRFRGREPRIDALLERNGIKPSK